MITLIQKLLLPVATMTWAIWYVFDVMNKSAKAAAFIKPVVCVMAVLFIINTITDIRDWRKSRANETQEHLEEKQEWAAIRKVLICIASIALYYFILPYLGFLISTTLYLLGSFMFFKAKKGLSLILSPVLSVAVYVIFDVLLKISLPTGFLGI